ncbi:MULTISPECIES: ABC transporter ATP-binding protein [Caldilinea]|uniref:Putative branched-chain amino acid ABC transporter permease/ATP-binding protein n=1 Tax=Caldilinea aerophila (strain DSM 14535 / JCM 11387 / NBRC 104270 / STL-6-O1) TaxID=926550 RepID=I0I3N6_CALAS|nr:MULTISPECIES: ABC transporter ATP-binding protein [Caldilinea]BAL99873.1 putative branched-chain amino acid ABC transporter permease/ATP-binding protein [Caldilinea aerophila DSM 14535 = NBRC 104270]GIV73456.1 MAG: ABC transporter ATP-binding protein [Caldilinea sp.]
MALLEIQRVTRAFDGVLAVNEVSFQMDEGETVSIIGPNGAGKTTLFNLITGLDRPDQGDIRFNGESLTDLPPHEYARRGLARTFQHGRVFGNLSVLDNVLLGAHSRRQATQVRSPWLHLARELFDGLFWPSRARQEEQALRAEAEAILAQFGERLLPRLHQPAYSLSYANRRRVEIARALLLRPRLLLLDEPTAGMNPAETAEMLAFLESLKARGQTILLIEHKLSLVMKLSDRVVVMDEGRIIAEGAPEIVRSDPRVIEAYLGHRHTGQALAASAEKTTRHTLQPPVASPSEERVCEETT